MYYFIWSSGRWELIYYISVAILTLLIAFLTLVAVWIARKSHLYQAREFSILLCKCTKGRVLDERHNYNLYLEIYNHGTVVARNIAIKIENREFGIISFLKPSESYELCIASFDVMQDGSMRIYDSPISSRMGGNCFNVMLNSTEYQVDLFIIRSQLVCMK